MADVTTGVTDALSRLMVESRWADISADVRHEGKRSLLNWLGCALGGCREEAIDRGIAALSEFSGPKQATLVGRSERMDVPNAAFFNAMSANTLDFDDTHLRTVIHPSAPVAAAVFAFAEHRLATGAELLHAFILGVEAECRIGNAVSPGHYTSGWHITGTCGVFGAATAVGRLLKLNSQQMAWAIGHAATQSAGLVASLGNMAKSINIGIAAKNGLIAALLAAKDFTASDQGIEHRFGFANVLGKDPDFKAITDRLGDTWEVMQNAYKPYPCGVVLHPVLDACLALHSEHRITGADIASVDVRVNPLAILRADRPDPQGGLDAKVSLQHGVAVCFERGAAGVPEFTDACVHEPVIAALRTLVRVSADDSVNVESAQVRLATKDGRKLEQRIAHALGSTEQPMSDAQLEAKFLDLAAFGAPGVDAKALIARMQRFEHEADAAEVVRRSAAG